MNNDILFSDISNDDKVSILDGVENINSDLKNKIPEEIGILPIRKLTIFPFQITPLMIGNSKSIKLIDEKMISDRLICIVTERENTPQGTTDYNINNLYKFGTVSKILRMIKLPNNNVRILIQGLSRARIAKYTAVEPYIKAKVELLQDIIKDDIELDALKRNIISTFQKVASFIPQIGEELQIIVMNIEDPGKLADLVASNINITTVERQELLETLDVKKRLEKILKYLNKEIQVLELGTKIQTKVKSDLEKKQKEFFLRQELDAIKKELGETDNVPEEVKELRDKIKEAKMPENVNKIALKELDRMQKMQPGFAEYSVIRTYIEWLIDLPWSKSTKDNLDLKKVQKVLNEDHYDLEKIKERIIEFLSVRKLKKDMKGPILCLVGPPGVGKTSLGQSIAKAMNRKFVRVSLGGIRDEAEIRGHRRTYVGALPGRIILGMKNAGSNNPVFMLDEIDKIGTDFRGDPASALLEVLDPQQNNSFVDHYLDVAFNLTNVFFITTANMLDTIPPALLDRMEILRIPGYTLEEKVKIAKRYLIPRQIKENGITNKKITFTVGAVRKLIKEYTREAGVRNLEREIGNVCRKIARKIVERKKYPHKIEPESIEHLLGPKRFFQEVAERITMPGIATGLAWTPVGGSILFIEATRMSGKGELKLTGKLGDVMKESAAISLSYLHSNCKKYKIDCKIFEENSFHIHVPEGATPKDGPSAGITITSALYSLLTNKKIKSDFAMTGEMTLRGKILPVGGIKEKVLAAKEAGIKNIIIPKNNKKDLNDLQSNVKNSINFYFIDSIDDALKLLF